MKIAFLSRYQNSIQRGAETFVYELSSRLRKKNIVDILEGNKSDSLTKVLVGKYDIVISMNGGFQSLKASIGRIFGRYKVIIVGQAGLGKVAIWNTAIVQPDVFVALTDYMGKWVKNWAWNSQVVKINNGVDLNRFKTAGERVKLNLTHPVILSVGALEWYKHHDRVIRAVREIRGGSVLIVGKGPEEKKLRQTGEDLLGNRFRIANFAYADMPKVYRSCDLFTLPSWDREAFGIVYLEAMASGLGVVAPNDSSRREVVGDAGLFTDVSSPAVYAEAIGKALRVDWSKKARAQAEKFSWERVAEEYEKLMFDMIKV